MTLNTEYYNNVDVMGGGICYNISKSFYLNNNDFVLNYEFFIYISYNLKKNYFIKI